MPPRDSITTIVTTTDIASTSTNPCCTLMQHSGIISICDGIIPTIDKGVIPSEALESTCITVSV